MFAPYWNNSYYLEIILQIVCIVHALRTGRREWVYLILFLPLVGGAIYFFREILPEINSGEFGANLQRVFLPNHQINEWERRVRMSDTVANRLQLADAYAAQKQYDKAISLAESCLSAHHANDQGILLRLARLYFYAGRYNDSVVNYEKVLLQKNYINLRKQEDDLLYARALEGIGAPGKAEEEYKRVTRVHHSMEGMYYYGLFLKKNNRMQEADAQFHAVIDEIDLHPRYVRRLNRQWVSLAKRELRS
jgi:hypothetical protein